MAMKAIGYNDLMKSLENLQDNIKRSHNCTRFNRALITNVEPAKKHKSRNKNHTSSNLLEGEANKVRKKRTKKRTIISKLSNNAAHNRNPTDPFPLLPVLPQNEPKKQRVTIRNLLKSNETVVHKPILPSVMTERILVEGNKLALKKRLFPLNVEPDITLDHPVHREVQNNGEDLKGVPEAYISALPFSAKNSSKFLALTGKKQKSVTRTHRVALAMFDLPFLLKHDVDAKSEGKTH